MLEILKTRAELTHFLKERRPHLSSIGLVPTMGALHAGHLSLIARSVADNDLTVCSIFVNPTQFNDPSDLARYPRPVESDVARLSGTGCDVLFLPDTQEIYPEEEDWHIELGTLERVLEGRFRPGHYQGVTQVVKKLFDLTAPDQAYFGQKDYQQYLVIRELVRQFNMPIELVCCPTLREPDGLAMSSRNVHLSPGEREEAVLLSKALFRIKDMATSLSPLQAREQGLAMLAASSRISVDYLELVDAETLHPVTDWEAAPVVIALAAIRIGQTRLIDNLFIQE